MDKKIEKCMMPQTTAHGKKLWRTKRKAKIDSIIVHYISAVNLDSEDPFNFSDIYNIFIEYGISCHYLIKRDGSIFNFVKDENVAYHAGKSKLHGRSIRSSCNDFSLGIELVGGKWTDFTDEQYDSLAYLTNKLQVKYKIEDKNIVGHETIAPKRKVDPGKRFRWNVLWENIDAYRKENKYTIQSKYKEMTNNLSSGNVGLFARIINTLKTLFSRGAK